MIEINNGRRNRSDNILLNSIGHSHPLLIDHDSSNRQSNPPGNIHGANGQNLINIMSDRILNEDEIRQLSMSAFFDRGEMRYFQYFFR